MRRGGRKTYYADEVAAQRSRVKDLKAATFSRHRDARPVAARDYVTIPFALVMVTEGSLRQLLADEAVDSIEEDAEGELTLSHSTGHVGATAAHTRQPVDYRGKGQMIVVIDHGVDGTHAFSQTAQAGFGKPIQHASPGHGKVVKATRSALTFLFARTGHPPRLA